MNRFCAFTHYKVNVEILEGVPGCASGSPSRMKPWSTKTAVSLSPNASAASAVATLLSMPPLKPIMALESPTSILISFDHFLDEVFHFPVGFALADVEDEVAQHECAVFCVDDFWVPLQTVDGFLLASVSGNWAAFSVRQNFKIQG